MKCNVLKRKISEHYLTGSQKINLNDSVVSNIRFLNTRHISHKLCMWIVGTDVNAEIMIHLASRLYRVIIL